MKRILAIISILLISAPVLAQPVTAVTSQSTTIQAPSPDSRLLAPQVVIGTCVGCAGYDGFAPSGTITKVTAKWNVPQFTCNSSSSIAQGLWTSVYLLGYDTPNAITTGFDLQAYGYCSIGSSSPSFGINLIVHSTNRMLWSIPLSLALVPGHTISEEIAVTPASGRFVVTMTDTTNGQVGTVHATLSYFQVVAKDLNHAGWTFFRAPDLVKFAPAIKFAGCKVVSSGVKHPIAWLNPLSGNTMVDESNIVQATLSALNPAGAGFRLTFVGST